MGAPEMIASAQPLPYQPLPLCARTAGCGAQPADTRLPSSDHKGRLAAVEFRTRTWPAELAPFGQILQANRPIKLPENGPPKGAVRMSGIKTAVCQA